MGVNYYTCSGCDIGYRDDSEYCAYCDCGNGFCSAECGGLKNYGEWKDKIESHAIDPEVDITCKICRKEAANDYVLLQTLLKHFCLTKEDALDIYKNQKD